MQHMTGNYHASMDKGFDVTCTDLKHVEENEFKTTPILKIGPVSIFTTRAQLCDILATIESYLRPLPDHPCVAEARAQAEGQEGDDLPF